MSEPREPCNDRCLENAELICAREDGHKDEHISLSGDAWGDDGSLLPRPIGHTDPDAIAAGLRDAKESLAALWRRHDDLLMRRRCAAALSAVVIAEQAWAKSLLKRARKGGGR